MPKFLAGAAKSCITPPTEMMPAKSFMPIELEGVHDNIYVRIIALDDGNRKFFIIVYESADMDRVSDLQEALRKEYNVLPGNIFFTVTHTHGAPSFANNHPDNKKSKEKYEWVTKYGDFIVKKTVECAGKAIEKMRPARYGFGTGNSYINVCRDIQFENGEWGMGRNFERPSDKELSVLKIEDFNGRLIAGLLNYAVHGSATFLSKDKQGEKYLISGDLPGMVSDYLEKRYKEDDSVFVWTSGAAGDQDAIFSSRYNKLDPSENFNTFYDMGFAVWSQCEHLARTQGTDVVSILKSIKKMKDHMNISVVDKIVKLPYGPGCEEEREKYNIDKDGIIELVLKLFTIDDIAYLGVGGELVCSTGLKLKETSPLKNTFIINQIAERIEYLPDKQGYKEKTFEGCNSLVKDGCTEDYILPAMLEMIKNR